MSFDNLLLESGMELFSNIRQSLIQSNETVFILDKVVDVGLDLLEVKLERILALGDALRVIAIERPVARRDSSLGLLGHAGHTGGSGHSVLHTRRIVDHESRTVVSFGFRDGLDGLTRIGGDSDGGDVDVLVLHGHTTQVLLHQRLAASSELGDSGHLSGLGLLTTGVGVHFGIEDEDVDVFALSEDVIDTTVANIVGPAISTNNPLGQLGHDIDSFFEESEFVVVLLFVGKKGAAVVVADFALGGITRILQPGLEVGAEFLGLGNGVVLEETLNTSSKIATLDQGGDHHTETEFGVIFEERGTPGRTLTTAVDGVGVGGEGTTPDTRATHGIGDHESLAEELSEDTDRLGFTATSAGTREFNQRFLEGAALDGLLVDEVALVLDGHGVFPVLGFDFTDFAEVGHGESLSGTVDGADFARSTIHRRDLDTVVETLEFVTDGRNGLEGGGSVLDFVFIQQERTNADVGTESSAEVALSTLLRVPDGNDGGNASLLVLGGTGGLDTTGDELGDGNAVAFHVQSRIESLEEFGSAFRPDTRSVFREVGPFGRNVDLVEVGEGLLDGIQVHVDHFSALAVETVVDILLEQLGGTAFGEDGTQVEEDGLHDHVDTLLETDALGDGGGIDGVELSVLLGEISLQVVGEVLLQVFDGLPGSVEDEGTALLELVDHVELAGVGGVVAGNVISLLNEVFGLNGVLADTDVGDGETARLVGIVDGVGLSVEVGVLDNHLHSIVRGTDSTIGTVTPEDALFDVVGESGKRGTVVERSVAQIIIHTNDEAVSGLGSIQVIEASLDHGRSEVLTAETDLTADDGGGALQLIHGGDDIQVERFTRSTIFTATIQDADLLAGLGKSGIQVLLREGSEEMDLDDTDLLALLVQVVDGFLDGGTSTHHDNDTVGIGSTSVVEQVVLTTGDGGDLVHGSLDLFGASIVEGLGDNAVLHVDILGLGDTTLVRMVGVQSSLAEVIGSFVGIDLGDFFARNGVDGVDFVRDSPTVEEVQEGNTAGDGGQVGDESQIVSFLDAVRGEDGETGLTSSHDIGVFAEKRKGLLGDHTRGDVDDSGKETTGNTIHVGNHQHHTLGGSKGGSEKTTDERTMESTSSTGFGLGMMRVDRDMTYLHFANTESISENILSTLNGPGISVLTHRGRGTDGIENGSIADIVSGRSSSFITINSSTN